jgi:hypothetical protein
MSRKDGSEVKKDVIDFNRTLSVMLRLWCFPVYSPVLLICQTISPETRQRVAFIPPPMYRAAAL